MNEEEIEKQLKKSRRQNKDERYEYINSHFNQTNYAMALEKYTLKILRKYMQLQNNWNELKKWLGTRINTDKDYERNSHIKEKLQVEDYVIKQVMFFMQELEDKDE